MADDHPDDDWEEIPIEWEPSPAPDWRPVGAADGVATQAPQDWRPVSPSGPPVGARKPRGTLGWDIMLGIDLGIVALGVLLSIAAYLIFVATGNDFGASDADPVEQQWTLFFGLSVNLVLFGIVPLAWVVGTRVGGWAGAVRFLQLDAAHTAWWGVPIAIGLVVVALASTLILDQFGLVEETPNTEALLGGMTWPLVFFVSFVAGTSEEILFRGVLQKWLGWIGQGVLFGLFHLGNGITGLVVTMAIGLLFGYLVKRGVSLWVVMAAHFTYDLILLSFAMAFAEFG